MLLVKRGSWPPILFRPGRGLAAILIAGALLFIALASLQQSAQATNKVWQNNSTNFNASGSWSPSGIPGASDVSVFNAAMVTQPNLSSSLTIQELNFSTTTASGYDLTSSNTSVKLTLTNTGTAATSAINAANTSGTNTIDAPVILGAAGGLTQTFTQASGGTLVVNGIISSTNTVTLSLAGAGIIQLAGANTYAGATTVASGTTLSISNATALGTTASGTTVASGATLQLQGGIIVGAEALTISGTGVAGQNGALVNVSGTNDYGGLLTLGAATTISSDSGTLNLTNAGTITGATFGLTLTGAGTGSISSIIGTTSGTVTKSGTGTWTLSGTNTYTGTTTVNAGTLIAAANNALGSTAHVNTVNSSGTLGIQGGVTLNSNETISISGTGAAGRQGAIDNISGTNTIAGQITVATNSRIGVTVGSLTLSGTVLLAAAAAGDTTLTFNPAASTSITVSGKISDQGSPYRLNFDQVGSGTVTISNGTNDYWGTDIHIGTAGGSTTGTLALGASGALSLANGVGQLVTIYSGTLDLNNFNATINGLTLGGGAAGSTAAVTTGTGVLTLNNNVTYNAANNPLGATIAGKLDLGAATRSFTIGDSTNAAADLTVSGIVSGAVGLTKTGAGTMVLSGANTYTGATTISAGILNIQNATALGTTASGTTVSSGATLQLQGGITVGAEALTIRGTGAAGQNGALVNVSGTNNYGGLLTLGAASTISSDSGTLNFTNSGTIVGATFGLTLTGSGSGSMSSIIGTTSGSLTKSGSGTWTLSGANTYTGATTVNAGTLSVTGSLASGSAVTVNNSGSVLEGTGTIYGSVSIASSGAILEAGTGSTGQTLTMRGAVTMGSGSILELALGASGAHSTLAMGIGGSISFQSLQKFNIINLGVTDGSTYNGLITGIGSDPGTESGWTITNQAWVYNFSYDAANGGEIDLTVSAVPEPSTYLAGALALAALTYNQRRRIRLLISDC